MDGLEANPYPILCPCLMPSPFIVWLHFPSRDREIGLQMNLNARKQLEGLACLVVESSSSFRLMSSTNRTHQSKVCLGSFV